MVTFMESIKLQFFPRPMVSNLLRRLREFILDESQNDNARFRAIEHLYRSPYAEDFVDIFVQIGANENDQGVARSGALYGLWYLSEKNSIAAENLVSIFLKPDKHSKFSHLGGMEEFRFRFPIDDYMDGIKSAICDQSLPDEDRRRIIRAANKSLSRQSRAYVDFTSASIGIAEDIAEDSYTRFHAMWTLDPGKHKDVLWALKADGDERVRKEAIRLLNH